MSKTPNGKSSAVVATRVVRFAEDPTKPQQSPSRIVVSQRTPADAPAAYWNPYLCGILLGLVLIASYTVLGTGVGASAGPSRFVAQIEQWVAPTHVATTEYFASWGEQPLAYYLVFMFVGTFFGGLLSALLARRVHWEVERGKGYPTQRRLMLALGGGILVGFASRLARGCTSGQALSGGALLLTGSLIFVGCLFLSGYATSYLFRRQWHD